jgi:hypothetical protein
MKQVAIVIAIAWLITGPTSAADWITQPSYFTHDPTTGKRVRQYSPIGPFYTYPRGDFTRSGFRHTRSSIQVGGSADHYHVTEEWGKPIQPYGEWRFPYRPYSVPYDAWGPQLPAVVGGGFGGRGFGGPGIGGPGVGVPPGPGVGPLGGGRNIPTVRGESLRDPGYSPQQQLLDGRYPPFEHLDPFERKQILDNLYPANPAP